MQTIDKNYVSKIDIQLAEFDAVHDKTASQIAQINKYKRIFLLRDKKNPLKPKKDKKIWEEF
ncbi:MAG: hypothetical protein JSR33_01725 [Proteobacteria bacterium]|nr:hypothetical protein [Pseudomonadota bacterium]